MSQKLTILLSVSSSLVSSLCALSVIKCWSLTTEARLGTEQLIEECEELRVKQLEVLKDVTIKYKSLMCGYLNEITMILRRTLEDPFHDIRLISTEILLTLIQNYAFNIHQFEGRIHPHTRAYYPASPLLVIAYALDVFILTLKRKLSLSNK